jgi:UDP-N-acetylglucosamine diphosphorylase/glucosamine-1-phosphate N-acetyltransferase
VIFIYEDELWRNLLPLVHLRPVFDLRCGRRTLLEKFQALYPREKLALLVRPELAALTRELHPGLPVNPARTDSSPPPVPRSPTPVLFLSGRAILDKPLPVLGPEEIFVNGAEIVGFRVNPARLGPMPKGRSENTERTPKTSSASAAILRAKRFCGSAVSVCAWRLPERKVLASIVRYPWNLIEFNEPELVRELREKSRSRKVERSEGRRTLGLSAPQISGLQVVGDPRNLRISHGARIDPGVVFDLRLGRVLVDERAEIRARSVVAGPCYVGPGTVIDAALVRPGCSFGPDCRIGGEVEASIFLGRSNKHHEGFIGHAVVGEWVNLGAMTSNSDLRNDYGEVKVTIGGRPFNTMLRKFGCIIGDHAKTAIGTLLNTGAVLGVFANWFEPGLSPRLIPDFARGSRARGEVGGLIETARIVMSRRGVRLSPEYEQLVRRLYAQT